MKWQIANAVLSSHTRWALKQGFNRYSPSYLGPYENCSLLAYISFYWFTYILNQIFENVTAKWTSPTKQLFYGQNLQSSQLKTKSAAIAFFCSPFFLLALSFPRFPFPLELFGRKKPCFLARFHSNGWNFIRFVFKNTAKYVDKISISDKKSVKD